MDILIPAFLLLLLGSAPSVDTPGFLPFLAPLTSASGPLTITRTPDALTFTRGSRTLSVLGVSARRLDGVQSPRGWLPSLSATTWGYADEIVLGLAEGLPTDRILGLEDRGVAQAEDAVLAQWQAWTASLRFPSAIPNFPALGRASITPDTAWPVEGGARVLAVLETLLPRARHLDATLGPRRSTYAARLVGLQFGADSAASLLTVNVELSRLPEGRESRAILDQSSGPTHHAFSFTTDSWLVRAEVSPAAAVSSPGQWQEAFRALDR